MSGTLYIVATPIGNLDDLAPRARQVLADVSLVAAEDTRHTGRLLSHIGLQKRQMALHDHNEAEQVKALIEELQQGNSVALVSDAGTPLLSDPGYRLVAAAHEASIAVSPVPGPSALTAALSAAGLPTNRFTFEGFLPARQAARVSALDALAHEPRTLVFFESVHRIDAFLEDAVGSLGPERRAFIGRELTKLHEQCINGTLGELRSAVHDGSVVKKGEFVVCIAGSEAPPVPAVDADTLLTELAAVLPGKQAAALTAKLTGGRRNALYARMLELTGKQ